MRHALVLLVLLAASCGSQSEPASREPTVPSSTRDPAPAPASPPPAAAAPSPAEPSPAAPSPAPATPTAAATDAVVLARVVQSGPIGHGTCTQCSHQVVIEQRVTGTIGDGATPLWVHFEACGEAQTAPRAAPAIDPCTMRRDGTYRLTLRPGGSPNFGDAPTIVEATPR